MIQVLKIGSVAVFAVLLAVGCTAETTQDAAESSPPVEVASEGVMASEDHSSDSESADARPEEEATATPGRDTSVWDMDDFGDDSLLEGLTPESWRQAGDIEHYNVASLYDKIDGRSELYMAYDVVGLSWVSFVHPDDANLFMDVFVYDMRSPTGAFGIYSVERDPGQEKVTLGREGYRTGSNLYFWKGRYYVYVQTSSDTQDAMDAGLRVAQNVADRLPDTGEPVQGIDLVPAEGLVEDTIQFFRADAMSLDFMTDTYTAKYDIDGMIITAFMSQRPSDADAESIVAQFSQYLEAYGSDLASETVEGVEITFADFGGGFYDAIFRSGSVVGGVTAVEGGDETLKAAAVIANKLTGQP